MKEQIIKKELEENSSNYEINLVCKWKARKNEVYNGLCLFMKNGFDDIGSIKFCLNGISSKEDDYEDLLCSKIYETFGVANSGLAAKAVTDCLNCFVDEKILKKKPEKILAILEKYGDSIISLFQEMRPKDIYELMMVTKIIILNILSNTEFIGSWEADLMDVRTMKQSRGIKLSRLFLEFKEKLAKHRNPSQQILVQHNHIHNEGQAIIGSQLRAGGREK
jgi:hypothetical protein